LAATHYGLLAARNGIWGAGLEGSPVFSSTAGDRVTVFMIPVAKWSDGWSDSESNSSGESIEIPLHGIIDGEETAVAVRDNEAQALLARKAELRRRASQGRKTSWRRKALESVAPPQHPVRSGKCHDDGPFAETTNARWLYIH